ncbi:MAG: hypothetical protein HOQ24_05435 [Mycobacteriaceae bacterium]|nr:hypothetical protein [Mycobacteriaceae bacterium]
MGGVQVDPESVAGLAVTLSAAAASISGMSIPQPDGAPTGTSELLQTIAGRLEAMAEQVRVDSRAYQQHDADVADQLGAAGNGR